MCLAVVYPAVGRTLPNVPSPNRSTVCMLSMSCALVLLLTASCRRMFSIRSAGCRRKWHRRQQQQQQQQ